MTIKRLKSLLTIKETGSFSQAAEKAHISQSAMSQQMRQLEYDLGLQLFDRSGRTPVLSKLTIELLPTIQDAVDAYDKFINLATSENIIKGELSLGSVPSELTALVPKALTELKGKLPGLRLRVVPALSAELCASVYKGKIDAAVMSRPSELQKGLSWFTIGFEPLALAISRSDKRSNIQQILTETQYLKLPSGTWINRPIKEIFTQLDVKPATSIELDSLASVASMVSHGLGVAILPIPIAANEVSSKLKFIPIDKSKYKREIGILYKKSSRNYSLIETFAKSFNTVVTS